MLKLRALTKKFDHLVVLNDANLDIQEGSIFGLIGPNGAGKSTLLRLISGVLKPDLGCVSIGDEMAYDNEAIKKDILLISDDPYFFFNSSLKDMREFYKVWYPNFNDKEYEKYLKIFGLDDKKAMKDFSKGMKRQAFIIIALAIAPKYLLLDEAFDGLDPVMRLTFKRAIASLVEKKEMTIIISSHNLQELEDICDTFGILEGGKLSTSGNIDDAKGNIHKVQVAFKDEVKKELFYELDILSITIQSRVVNIVVKGDIQQIEDYLQTLQPLMIEILNVNLEEVFIYEMEKKGYGINE